MHHQNREGTPWLANIEAGRQHLSELRTAGDLARLCGVSLSHFTRCFTRDFGIGPSEYLQQRRLQRVHYLLLSTEKSLSDIAARVGFRDVTALGHAWRRAYGLPPGQWRRQQKL